MAEAKALLIFDVGDTGLAIGDLTFNFIKTIDDGTTVIDTDSTLVELGRGYYTLMNPNITEDTIFSVYPTAQSTKVREGVFSLYYDARLANVAHGGAEATFQTAVGYLSQEASAGGTEKHAKNTIAQVLANRLLSLFEVTQVTMSYSGTIVGDAYIDIRASNINVGGSGVTLEENGTSIGWIDSTGYTEQAHGELNSCAIFLKPGGLGSGSIEPGILTITIYDALGTHSVFVPITGTVTDYFYGWIGIDGSLIGYGGAAPGGSTMHQAILPVVPDLRGTPTALGMAAGNMDTQLIELRKRIDQKTEHVTVLGWDGAVNPALEVSYSKVLPGTTKISLAAYREQSLGQSSVWITMGELTSAGWAQDTGNWTGQLVEGLYLAISAVPDGSNAFPAGVLTIKVLAGRYAQGQTLQFNIPLVPIGGGSTDLLAKLDGSTYWLGSGGGGILQPLGDINSEEVELYNASKPWKLLDASLAGGSCVAYPALPADVQCQIMLCRKGGSGERTLFDWNGASFDLSNIDPARNSIYLCVYATSGATGFPNTILNIDLKDHDGNRSGKYFVVPGLAPGEELYLGFNLERYATIPLGNNNPFYLKMPDTSSVY